MSNTQKTLIGTIPIPEMKQEVDNLVNETKQNYPAIECFETLDDPESRSEITLDSSNKIISYRKPDGTKVENVGLETLNVKSITLNTEHLELTEDGMTEFQQELIKSGFKTGIGDWSDYLTNDGKNPLCIAEPRCAIMNIISDYDLTKLNKKGRGGAVEKVNYNIPTQVEFYDMDGNYFKKWTLITDEPYYEVKNLTYEARHNVCLKVTDFVNGAYVELDNYYALSFANEDASFSFSNLKYQTQLNTINSLGRFTDEDMYNISLNSPDLYGFSCSVTLDYRNLLEGPIFALRHFMKLTTLHTLLSNKLTGSWKELFDYWAANGKEGTIVWGTTSSNDTVADSEKLIGKNTGNRWYIDFADGDWTVRSYT